MNFSLSVTLVFLTLIFIELSLHKYNVSEKYRIYVFLLTIGLLISYEFYANPKNIKEFFLEVNNLENIPSLEEKDVERAFKKGDGLKLDDFRKKKVYVPPPVKIVKKKLSFTHPYQMIIITRDEGNKDSENTDYYVFSNKLNPDSRIYSHKNINTLDSNESLTKYSYIKKTEDLSENNKYGANALYFRNKNFDLKTDNLRSISCTKSNDCKEVLADKKITFKNDNDVKQEINYSNNKSFLTCDNGTCKLYDEYIILAGGHGDNSTIFSNSIDILHLNLKDWSTTTFKSKERKTYVSGIRHNDKIYFIGGLFRNMNYSNKIEVFDINEKEVINTLEMQEGYCDLKLTIFDNKIIIYGGYGSKGYQTNILLFDPEEKDLNNNIKIVNLPSDVKNFNNLCLTGFENHFILLTGSKNTENIEFNSKLVYYLHGQSLYEKTVSNNINKTIGFFNMGSFSNSNINNKLLEIHENPDNSLVISLSFNLEEKDLIKEGWIFGNNNTLFGLYKNKDFLVYKMNNVNYRLNLVLQININNNLILNKSNYIYNLQTPINYVPLIAQTDYKNDFLNLTLNTLEIYNNNLSDLDMFDIFRNKSSDTSEQVKNAFIYKYNEDKSNLDFEHITNFKYNKMENLICNQKMNTSVFKFFDVDLNRNQTLIYENKNRDPTLNQFKAIFSKEGLNPIASFTNNNVGVNFETNIYFSSIDILENASSNLTLSTNLEKIIIGDKNNTMGSSEINTTKNIIVGYDTKNYFNGAIIDLTIKRNDKLKVDYSFANIGMINYNAEDDTKILVDNNENIKGVMNNIDIELSTESLLSNKKSIIFNGINSSIGLPNINSSNFEIYFWFKTPIVKDQPLIVSPDGNWSIKIIDSMVYYVDNAKDKLLSNIILPNELYFIKSVINSKDNQTDFLFTEEIDKSINEVDKITTKCKLGQKYIIGTDKCIDCQEDEYGIKLNTVQYKNVSGKEFKEGVDIDDLLFKCQPCPDGTYTHGKTGETKCRSYNYYKPKTISIVKTDKTGNVYKKLLESINLQDYNNYIKSKDEDIEKIKNNIFK